MNWTMPYPWRSRSDSVRRINMSSEPGNESFFCALRPIPRILSLRRREDASQVQIGEPRISLSSKVGIPQGEETYIFCAAPAGRKGKEKVIRNRFSSSLEFLDRREARCSDTAK